MALNGNVQFVDKNPAKFRIAVVGGGLVGALNACIFAKRGHHVDLYELREDIRMLEHVPGRSINLALSIRGRSALKLVDLEDALIKHHGIPMYGRMIHDLSGRKKPIYYGKGDQCIYSVGRRFLNEVLLSAAEKYQNLKIHFHHKLKTADLEEGTLVFEDTKTGSDVTREANLIVGCDGAYSAVRRQMTKRPMFNYSQEYIPHGYLELCIPPASNGDFAMEKNYLHIWPRGKFMLIALPNQDHSWTVTLFMPFQFFSEIKDSEDLIEFFGNNFPDSIPLIGKEKLVKDFFRVGPSHLITVKCKPYHSAKAVLMGDAAHAMVPFYGQGMNAGMEDCLIFDELMQRHGNDLSKVLPEFTEYRGPDAEAICDLALYNYVEMRDLVNKKTFMLRKFLDNALNAVMPSFWVPLYTTVTFTRTRYHVCIKNRKWQDKVLQRAGWTAMLGILTGIAAFFTSAGFPQGLLGPANSTSFEEL